jgi:hypothetical protein
MRKQRLALCFVSLILLFAAVGASAEDRTLTTCRLDFALKGWSAVVSSATGVGVVTCDNGQRAEVSIKAKGAGLTAGKYEIRDGHGKFSQVAEISELFGSYATAKVGAGVVKDAEAAVMTKGPVSLALSGKGSGFELGVSLEGFSLERLP